MIISHDLRFISPHLGGGFTPHYTTTFCTTLSFCTFSFPSLLPPMISHHTTTVSHCTALFLHLFLPPPPHSLHCTPLHHTCTPAHLPTFHTLFRSLPRFLPPYVLTTLGCTTALHYTLSHRFTIPDSIVPTHPPPPPYTTPFPVSRAQDPSAFTTHLPCTPLPPPHHCLHTAHCTFTAPALPHLIL